MLRPLSAIFTEAIDKEDKNNNIIIIITQLFLNASLKMVDKGRNL